MGPRLHYFPASVCTFFFLDILLQVSQRLEAEADCVDSQMLRAISEAPGFERERLERAGKGLQMLTGLIERRRQSGFEVYDGFAVCNRGKGQYRERPQIANSSGSFWGPICCFVAYYCGAKALYFLCPISLCRYVVTPPYEYPICFPFFLLISREFFC